nr:TIR domain-containing protein [Bacilli bacterium]
MAIELCCCSCGGLLDSAKADGQVIKCEYCGKEQVIPSLDNEARLKSYRRATDLRLNKKFDDARRIYESMLLQFPDDFEVRWGLCLCKYGVEYIDDFDGKKIPICHRNLFESILEDEDYLFAISHCDGVSKEVMESDASYIDQVQKKYAQIAKTEKPYDVFISYKETELEGKNRTKDSLLAEELYDALTKEHYKVFFSRITLEDKLGQDYEPNIEFALSTAKVMLLVGTSVENIESTWVKSEWSRYLIFMRKERGKKTLIPCYHGFDPYELPDEISAFQAQDLAKIGAVKDVVRGIKKIINPTDTSETISSVLDAINKSGGDVASKLIRRAEIHIDRNELKEAKAALDKCLNSDPENSKAYALLALIAFGVNSLADLDDYQPNKPDYEKLYQIKVSEKKLNFNAARGSSDYVAKLNSYTPPKSTGSNYSVPELELIFDDRGFDNLLGLDDEEAKKWFNYHTIEHDKDMVTALRFADEKYKEELDKHLAAHLATKENYIAECQEEYNDFVIDRFEKLEADYRARSYKESEHACQSDPKKSCLSFLALGDYEDSSDKAFEAAKVYVTRDFLDVNMKDFITNNFDGEREEELLKLLRAKIGEKQKEVVSSFSNIRRLADENRGRNFDFDRGYAQDVEIRKIQQLADRVAAASEKAGCAESRAYTSEMTTAYKRAQDSVFAEEDFGRELRFRVRGISKATIWVNIAFILAALVVCFCANRTVTIFVDKDNYLVTTIVNLAFAAVAIIFTVSM